jgi:hypothetical protein
MHTAHPTTTAGQTELEASERLLWCERASGCDNVLYALTDRRLIIAVGQQKPKSFGAEAFQKMRRTGDRRGTVWLDYGPDSDGSSYRQALFGIPDAERVEQLLRQKFPLVEKQQSSWRPSDECSHRS